ncbi:MAG: DUF1638 domain-containing protein [Candidatus Methanoplasma sp.]|jgi:hypothetical protein|nr:DUF1638 domain-containing protein [Candidatus Methanoplasma sp.]
MRIGILACDILRNEMEFLTKDDPDFTHREYLEFALHENPENMREVIIERVGSMRGGVDAVLLGYAVCQSLSGITDVLDVPAVMLPGADCIDVLLGTEEYEAEKRICTGTWFSSPGWAEQGIDALVKEFHLDSVEGMDPSYFLDILFASYERCLFIDPGIGGGDEFLKRSLEFAGSLKLRHDCRTCGLDRLRDSIAKVKKLAASASPDG